MATIPYSELRHVRKTITLDGSANNGNLGDFVTVFQGTGRCMLEEYAIYVSVAPTCAAPTLTGIGVSVGDNLIWILGDSSALTVNNVGVGYVDARGTNTWEFGVQTPVDNAGTGVGLPIALPPGDVRLEIYDAGGGADITAGTIIFDAWYRPITNDGALAGDDIDADFTTTQLTESYAADGSAPTVAQALLMIQQMLTEMSIAGTVATVKKLDGSTTAATFTLNDASSPSSITRAS